MLNHYEPSHPVSRPPTTSRSHFARPAHEAEQSDSDTEYDGTTQYEEWAPSVLQRWDALMKGNKRDGKQYTAFLRFALDLYGIPAQVRAVWRKDKRGSGKHLALYIFYWGSARNKDDMRRKLADIREIEDAFPCYRFGIEWHMCSIKYNSLLIFDTDSRNGPSYFHDLMCIGKGSVPYLPHEIRDRIMNS